MYLSFVFGIDTNSWEPTEILGLVPEGRAFHTSCAIGLDDMLMFGGFIDESSSTSRSSVSSTHRIGALYRFYLRSLSFSF